MATQLMREALRPLYSDRTNTNAHPGLLIQRGFEEYSEENKEAKTKHIQRICSIKSSPFYANAYQRWRTITADQLRFRQLILGLEGRLLIGLTGGGMLETGCAIHHVYGMPYIPGSSIKGVVRAQVCGSPFAVQHPEVVAELFGTEADPTPGTSDSQGLSGLVTFHDAWWVPDSAERPLVEEIVTTHHPDYYGSEGQKNCATDFDSPIPNAQIGVQGRFLFVLEGPPERFGWLDLAEKMLITALSERGIGAKTRTGYGLFDPQSKIPAGPVCAWVDDTLARLAQQNRTKPDEVLRSKGLAAEWAALTDPALKAEALEDIRSRWQAQGWWDDPPGKSAKQARAIYGD
ncbi:type III-B CRISPR module RAMP protein Cmr6 [Thiorhodospira sibirica]|uniref:type III-B CRISPR module RAMP protein Cmr6 n=1 Tax=Thiorhodospira sibirica TaxID=154347 RepID=UPI00022C529C|nr:type III-B CRISPR module RAMP protein Cmr6 [Thiorhodospira sibirica]